MPSARRTTPATQSNRFTTYLLMARRSLDESVRALRQTAKGIARTVGRPTGAITVDVMLPLTSGIRHRLTGIKRELSTLVGTGDSLDFQSVAELTSGRRYGSEHDDHYCRRRHCGCSSGDVGRLAATAEFAPAQPLRR